MSESISLAAIVRKYLDLKSKVRVTYTDKPECQEPFNSIMKDLNLAEMAMLSQTAASIQGESQPSWFNILITFTTRTIRPDTPSAISTTLLPHVYTREEAEAAVKWINQGNPTTAFPLVNAIAMMVPIPGIESTDAPA